VNVLIAEYHSPCTQEFGPCRRGYKVGHDAESFYFCSRLIFLFTFELLNLFLISNFRRVLNIVCFLLGNSSASQLYMPTFRHTVCSISIGLHLPMKMEQIVCFETSEYKIETPGNYPKENTL